MLLTIISIQVNPRSYKVEVITYCLIRQEGKLELSKSSNQSTKARKRQAEMTKMENPVTGIGEKGKLK